ncbi:MAG TPA: flagellar biosynthesis protein FlhF [bacterium]|nr:flagellar biosynthesis protein FlhF [bacterium]
MKVKRYEAPTLQEALLHVKRELGSEAVILQTRKFNRGGVFGFLGKNMVEVLAATDIETAGATKQQLRPAHSQGAQQRKASPQTSAQPAQAGQSTEVLRDELREMKSALHALLQKNQTETSERVEPYPSIFGDIYLKLLENDVDDTIAQDIIRSMDDSLQPERKEDDQAVEAALERQLRRLLKISGQIELTGREQRTIALVGSTGVGKTTTIAKLATIFSLQKRKKVGIITADTYRIAAVEQIKVYCDILNVPVRVVYNAEDMKRAVDFFADRDLIFIDTAGRSHWDTERIKDVRDLLAVCYPLEIHLVMGAQTRYRDMVDIAERYRPLAYNHLIFTKLDETSAYGNLINLITKINTGVSYLCYGQNVPGEIQPATLDSLVSLILGKPLAKAVGAKR